MSEEEIRGPSVAVAAAAWGVGALVLATAIGTLAQLVGAVGSVGAVAGVGAAVGVGLGAAAGAVEARRAARRPILPDGRGQPTRRTAAWVPLVPLAAGAAGLSLLVILATVQQEAPVLGAGFAVAALACGGVARSVWTQDRLARAAEAAAEGRRRDASAGWTRIATSPLSTRTGREHAALNLGLATAIDGDLDASLAWYAQVRRGRALGFARVGQALVHVLGGRWIAAEQALAEASTVGRALQAELDGVRLLLVLRRDGPAAARRLGERLVGPGAGTLFLGALLAARAADAAPSPELEFDAVIAALRHTGLLRLLPELDAGWDRLDEP